MNKTLTIARKEIRTYLESPMAYIILFISLCVFNIFFFLIVDQNREANLRDVFKVIEFMFVFIIPLLTMKTLAEEKAAGTLEFLMTTPTTNTAIVVGKYLGLVGFYSLMVAGTLIYYLLLTVYSSVDHGEILSGYFGLWLEGCFFLALGLFMSALTQHQLLAAITSYGLVFLLYFSLSFISYLHGPIEIIFRHLSVMTHSANFFSGLITLADLTYFVSGILGALLLTRFSIENRIWK